MTTRVGRVVHSALAAGRLSLMLSRWPSQWPRTVTAAAAIDRHPAYLLCSRVGTPANGGGFTRINTRHTTD